MLPVVGGRHTVFCTRSPRPLQASILSSIECSNLLHASVVGWGWVVAFDYVHQTCVVILPAVLW